MNRSTRPSLVAVVAICTAAQSRTAFSAEPDATRGTPSVLAPPADPPRPEARLELERPRPVGRELGGHVFTPVLGTVGPFATTNFGSFMALGKGSTQGTLTLQVPGTPAPPPQTFTGDVSYAALGGIISFEYAFVPGVSARVGISQTVYSGLNGASAAVVGTNVRFGGGVGLTAGIPIGQRVRLAAVVDATYAPRLGLILGPAIESAFARCAQSVANCQFNFDEFFQRNNVLTVQPGVAAAWAPARALGFTFNVSYVYTSIATDNQDTIGRGGVAPAVAVDFDFMGISKVPIGLQISWASLFTFANDDLSTGYTDLGGAIFYTGRKELSLGIQVVDRRFRVSPDVDVSWNNILSLVGLRYYW